MEKILYQTCIGMQADQTVLSLRPGGGGGTQGRLFAPCFDSTSANSGSGIPPSASSDPVPLRPHGSSIGGFSFGSFKTGESFYEGREGLRYTRDQLLQIRESVQLPNDILKIKQEIDSEIFGEDQSWGHGDSNSQSQQQNRYSEPDNRDWRGRAPQGLSAGEDRSWSDNKDGRSELDPYVPNSRGQEPNSFQLNDVDTLSSQFSSKVQVSGQTKQSSCTSAGIKRHSTPLPHVIGCTAEAAGNELPWLAIPRKKQNTTRSLWICEVCDISCTSSDALADHRLGKKHRRNVSRSKPNLDEGASSKDDSKALQINAGELAGGRTSDPAAGKSKSSPKKLGHNKNKVKSNTVERTRVKQRGDTTKFEFWCQLCGVRCNSISVRDKHLNGKKHNRLAWRSVIRDVKNDGGAIQSVEIEVKSMVGGGICYRIHCLDAER